MPDNMWCHLQLMSIYIRPRAPCGQQVSVDFRWMTDRLGHSTGHSDTMRARRMTFTCSAMSPFNVHHTLVSTATLDWNMVSKITVKNLLQKAKKMWWPMSFVITFHDIKQYYFFKIFESHFNEIKYIKLNTSSMNGNLKYTTTVKQSRIIYSYKIYPFRNK